MSGEALRDLQTDLHRHWSRRYAGDGQDGTGDERGQRGGTEAGRREGVRDAEDA